MKTFRFSNFPLYPEAEPRGILLIKLRNGNNEKHEHASIWSLQVLNLLGDKEDFGYYYDYETKNIEHEALTIIVPNISYKIEF